MYEDMPDEHKAAYLKAFPMFSKPTMFTSGQLTLMYEPDNKETFYASASRVVFASEDNLYSISRITNTDSDDSIRLRDKEKNGSFTHLSYTYLNSDGKPMGIAIDFTRDGQIDMRIDEVNMSREIWYRGQWHILNEYDKGEYVVIDGKKVLITLANGKYVKK